MEIIVKIPPKIRIYAQKPLAIAGGFSVLGG